MYTGTDDDPHEHEDEAGLGGLAASAVLQGPSGAKPRGRRKMRRGPGQGVYEELIRLARD